MRGPQGHSCCAPRPPAAGWRARGARDAGSGAAVRWRPWRGGLWRLWKGHSAGWPTPAMAAVCAGARGAGARERPPGGPPAPLGSQHSAHHTTPSCTPLPRMTTVVHVCARRSRALCATHQARSRHERPTVNPTYPVQARTLISPTTPPPGAGGAPHVESAPVRHPRQSPFLPCPSPSFPFCPTLGQIRDGRGRTTLKEGAHRPMDLSNNSNRGAPR
jgi:hypothetical protein